MNCPVCHSAKTISYYKAAMPQILSACPAGALKKAKVLPFEARLCLDCSLGFNATRLSARTLRAIYDDYLYISPRRGIGRTKFEGMLDTIKRHLSPTDEILDVGCSEGYLLEQIRDAGYKRLTGIEPGPQAVEARKLGLDVRRGYFHSRSLPGKRFDGIVLMHVFEHLADPVGMLKALKAKLSPTGKLIIEVPDFGGYHHQHLFFYTESSLRRMAEDIGLTICEVSCGNGVLRAVMRTGYEPYGDVEDPNLTNGRVISQALPLMKEYRATLRRLRALFKIHKIIYWWGAGSASVFWLNQIGAGLLKKADLTVVDGDKAKWGMFIPGVNIEVKPFKILAGETVDLVVIASEFSDEIRATMKAHAIQARRVEVVT